jgi:GTPase
MPLPYVLLFGRPNVGKSTLFNRFIGKNHAIVHDEAGVTRDIREAPCTMMGRSCILADTPGWQDDKTKDWFDRQRTMLKKALHKADVIVLVVDAKQGIVGVDHEMAQMARQTGKPVLLLANKAEKIDAPYLLGDMPSLGIDDVIPVSALHGIGMGDVEYALLPFLPEEGDHTAKKPDIHLTIMGRPNVGKSTLMNTLLKEERVLTGDMPHLTRDAISIDMVWDSTPIKLTDTAGLRRKAKVDGVIERASQHESKHALMFAHVAILVIDGVSGIDKQDLALANMIIDEGRALVIAVNKSDVFNKNTQALKKIEERIVYSLPQAKGVQLIPISALNDKGIKPLMKAVFEVYALWNIKITTGKLNQWLALVVGEHPPPRASGGPVKIRYMTQTKVRPPTFTLFTNRPDSLSGSYQQYLENRLRLYFKIPSIPLRFVIRGGDNPYVKN